MNKRFGGKILIGILLLVLLIIVVVVLFFGGVFIVYNLYKLDFVSCFFLRRYVICLMKCLVELNICFVFFYW